MYMISKQLDSFSAAHRLVKGYQGKCKDLHGHDYQVTVELICQSLDQYDFVIDFSEIKRICNQWLQDHWDHATIVCSDDQPLIDFLQQQQQHYFMLPAGVNSTAEQLAKFLFQEFTTQLHEYSPRVALQGVTVAESQTALATYSG